MQRALLAARDQDLQRHVAVGGRHLGGVAQCVEARAAGPRHGRSALTPAGQRRGRAPNRPGINGCRRARPSCSPSSRARPIPPRVRSASICFSSPTHATVIWNIAWPIGAVVSIHGSWRLRRARPGPGGGSVSALSSTCLSCSRWLAMTAPPWPPVRPRAQWSPSTSRSGGRSASSPWPDLAVLDLGEGALGHVDRPSGAWRGSPATRWSRARPGGN
jgi:hypothetical protein